MSKLLGVPLALCRVLSTVFAIDLRAYASAVQVELLSFRDTAAPSDPAISMTCPEYLQLLDWTGRAIRAGKRGAIDEHAPPILKRLNIDPEAWQLATAPAGNVFGRAIGRLDHLRRHAQTLGQSWVKGLRQAERLYRPA